LRETRFILTHIGGLILRTWNVMAPTDEEKAKIRSANALHLFGR